MGDFLSFSCGCEGGYPGAVWEVLMTDTILNLFGQVSRLWLAEGMCRNPVQDVHGLPLWVTTLSSTWWQVAFIPGFLLIPHNAGSSCTST